MNVRVATAVRILPGTAIADKQFILSSVHKAVDGQTVVVDSCGDGSRPMIVRVDEVYDEEDNQSYFYEQSVRDLVCCAFDGSYCTVLAYGAAGSGKTYSVLGPKAQENIMEEAGIFLRVFEDLFRYQEKMSKRRHIMFFVAALELVGEQVLDLLKRRSKIPVSDVSSDYLLHNFRHAEVTSMTEATNVFNLINDMRQDLPTDGITRGSRSSALIFIDIVQVAHKHFPDRPTRDKLVEVGGFSVEPSVRGILHSRVLLVDLVGSNIGRTSGIGGEEVIENLGMAKSLQTLGMCVRSLYVGDSHIPFCDAKLTELLKPSLAESTSRVLVVAHVSPLAKDGDETRETLCFCDRIKEFKADKSYNVPSAGFGEYETQPVTQHRELLADVRIAAAVAYYTPQRPYFTSMLKGVSVKEARDAAIVSLKNELDGLEMRKEAEYISKAKEKIMKDRDKRVRGFASRMNQMIEEYEVISQKVKEEKKVSKHLTREYEAKSEEAITEAKKAKKSRLKAQEKVENLREQLGLPKVDSSLPNQESSQSHKYDDDKMFCGGSTEELSNEERERETLLDNLVNDFQTAAKDLNDVHATYAKRLTATQRQRAQVRRIKMLCSGIILDSTLVEDIIDFIIDRAVDISHKVIKPSQPYSWKNIEGLSTVLRGGNRLYPPLFNSIPDATKVDSTGVFHRCTFLSSDESDEENSHYPDETRRPVEMDNDLYEHYLAMGNTQKKVKEDGSAGSQKKSAAKWGGEISETARDEARKPAKENAEDEGAEGSPIGLNASATESLHLDGDNDGEFNQSDNNVEESEEPLTESEKQRMRTRRDQQYLMRVYDSPNLVDDLIKFLRGGTVMLKHGRIGKPHRRLFWVSIDREKRKLLWADPDATASRSSSYVDLDNVSYIQIGCFSKVFKRHCSTSTDPSFYRSFTVGLKDGSRTVDIVADTLADFEAWVLGLSNLVRVDPSWGGKLDVSVEVNYDRLNCFEVSLCETNYIFPTQYLMLKRRVTQLAAHTLEVLQQCGNDVAKAQEILNGIHPPGINDKGAVYLTKGELRFVGRNEIDIIRITKIWMLFQQMNLVYDDNFVPATTFGITRRS